jgi:microcystin-dependent protein
VQNLQKIRRNIELSPAFLALPIWAEYRPPRLVLITIIFSPFLIHLMEPYVGEIRSVGFTFAPMGWAFCDGSLLQIRSNTALFSILGTQYGGDGQTTFALPDLRGRAIVNAGQGPGLTNYPIGAKAGVEGVALNLAQTPAHVHGANIQFNINTAVGSSTEARNNFLSSSTQLQFAEEAGSGTMASSMIAGTGASAGGGQFHDNRQPYLAVDYIIAVVGIFPQRP